MTQEWDPDAERALVMRLRAGDDEAFEDLLRQYGGRLLAVARRMLRHEDDARDAVQEGLLSAYRALPTFRGDCRLSTWLHRIVINAVLMHMRRRRRAPEVPIDDLLPVFQADGHHARAFEPWGDVERALAVRETRLAVRAAIDRLPDTYRTVLLLRDIEEMTNEEVAAALGVTVNAAKIRVHRARQALLTLLSPTFGESGTAAGSRPTAAASHGKARHPVSRRRAPVVTCLTALAAVPA